MKIIRECRWTRIATIDEYKEVINAIRDILNESGITKSLADWELDQFNEDRAVKNKVEIDVQYDQNKRYKPSNS